MRSGNKPVLVKSLPVGFRFSGLGWTPKDHGLYLEGVDETRRVALACIRVFECSGEHTHPLRPRAGGAG